MEEKIYFKNSKGNRLCSILSNPTGNKTKPVIIICHGFSSNKNRKSYIALKTELDKHYISSFRFDFYGHGESEGNFEDITVSEAVDDILNAIKFLKNKGFTKIGLIGSSFGGGSSLIAASISKDLYIVCLKSPVSDYREIKITKSNKEFEEWKSKGYIYHDTNHNSLKLNFTFFEDAIKNIAYKVVGKIKIPTLIVHGDHDETVPVNQSIKTSKLIPNCKLVLIKDADHTYTNTKDFEIMVNTIVDFIVKNSYGKNIL